MGTGDGYGNGAAGAAAKSAPQSGASNNQRKHVNVIAANPRNQNDNVKRPNG
ncbi:MAG: hypothetical protein ABI431_08760 [Candidatus Tumulicola sp.]